ncbi:hypothetical protein OB955_01540 [Halobacteria archaeon AArc-m2/3/4]|uniref:Uncharacterized protein n=1 Tax=Natronoglomus mannanivorans TaxID=2979990 RepID=A0AAP2YX37_9EURY|nr:hypothetical protein [Halobacteria archaeon AArc-xg1-1]MCU4971423.1 hypothetical protein [Halobacteria archaeon AArc-m2/3/4]
MTFTIKCAIEGASAPVAMFAITDWFEASTAIPRLGITCVDIVSKNVVGGKLLIHRLKFLDSSNDVGIIFSTIAFNIAEIDRLNRIGRL